MATTIRHQPSFFLSKWIFPCILSVLVSFEGVLVWIWTNGSIECSVSSSGRSHWKLQERRDKKTCLVLNGGQNLSNEVDGVFLHLTQKYPCSEGHRSRIWTFSFVDHPADRIDREFNKHVSFAENHQQPTWKNLKTFVESYHREGRSLMEVLSEERPPRQLLRPAEVIQRHDFIGTVDRLDESLVVLRHLFHLPWTDILYLPSNDVFEAHPKNSSECILQPLPVRTRARRELLAKEVENRKWTRDVELWKLVDQALDDTIAALGRRAIEREFKTFQELQDLAVKTCLPSTTYSCDVNGDAHSVHSCLQPNKGCGHSCLMELDLSAIVR